MYIPHLLAVEKKGGRVVRKKFQQLAATNGWTVPELQLAIQQKYPRQPGHGRTMKLPPTPLAGLEQLAFEAERFSRRCRHIVDFLARMPADRHRKSSRRRARDVAEVLDALEAAARASAKRLRLW